MDAFEVGHGSPDRRLSSPASRPAFLARRTDGRLAPPKALPTANRAESHRGLRGGDRHGGIVGRGIEKEGGCEE